MAAMLSACCPSQGGASQGGTGNGHRFLQMDQGCDELPATCSAGCAVLFIAYFRGCQSTINALPGDSKLGFVSLYADCNEVEQNRAAVTAGARPVVMFRVFVVNQEAAEQTAMANAGSGASPPPPGGFGPVILPPTGPPPPPSPGTDVNGTGAGAVQECHRVCSKANLTACAPQCNQFMDGYC